MWLAIRSVTSGLTFLAFFIAVCMTAYRWKLTRDIKVVQAAPESERGQLVLAHYGFFNIDTPGLTEKQKYDLVFERLRPEVRYFSARVAVAALVAVIFACVTAYAIAK